MNPYLLFVLVVLLGSWLVELVVELLNLRAAADALPAEFTGDYDPERYRQSQEYHRVTTRFGLWHSAVNLAIVLALILLGGFDWLDQLARQVPGGQYGAGLAFCGLLLAGGKVIELPFELYGTFVIEERFGFNQTNARTFWLDQVKALALLAIIGTPILLALIWFFAAAGDWAWVWAWGAMTLVQMLIVWIAPVLLLPLFNKFTPLEEGELRTMIEEYAREQDFQLSGIFTMDGSKRSAKANAFFTGFGRHRRIVLYDTLVEQLDNRELLAVLAHEMGHFKRRHIPQRLALAFASTGALFFLIQCLLLNQGLFDAFRMSGEPTIYASLVFVSFFYAPLSSAIGVLGNLLSRRHEFEADQYAARGLGSPEPLITGLKKLTVANLGNLTPHPLKVFLDYSHPPILTRLRALRQCHAEALAEDLAEPPP